MKYKYVLFDMDGTIIDSSKGVFDSVVYALRAMGVEKIDHDGLSKFIGPPLPYSFSTFYGMSEEEASRAVECFREYYEPNGMMQNKVYDGIRECVSTLKDIGVITIVATSKPEEFAKRILKHEGLDKLFDHVAGATLDEKERGTKTDILQYAIDSFGIDIDKALMVGDRKYDIEGAKHFVMDSCGVLYGFGDREELEEAGAEYIVEKIIDVIEIVR